VGLTFPTGHRGYLAPPGMPDRASHCQCERGPMLLRGHDACLNCGRYPKDTIAETWTQRAQEIAAGRAKRKR
jgi:hypothetical protein